MINDPVNPSVASTCPFVPEWAEKEGSSLLCRSYNVVSIL